MSPAGLGLPFGNTPGGVGGNLAMPGYGIPPPLPTDQTAPGNEYPNYGFGGNGFNPAPPAGGLAANPWPTPPPLMNGQFPHFGGGHLGHHPLGGLGHHHFGHMDDHVSIWPVKVFSRKITKNLAQYYNFIF